jgi:hypothetical protein
MSQADSDITLGEAAQRLGTQLWKVQRLFDRKFLAPPRRLGRTRMVRESELPLIREKLREAGYLKDAEEVHHAAG